MKDRIVIEDKEVKQICDDCIMSENCKKKNTYEQARCCFNFQFIPANIEVEQVPENFADLLTLCKDTKGCFVLRASDREYIEVPTDLIGYSFTFYQDGQIFADEDVCVKEKATPQQMWNIIKNLIGEE